MNDSCGNETPSADDKFKAEFLVKIAGFIQWPASTNNATTSQPFIIGILGRDSFGDYFNHSIKGEIVEGRPVEVRRATDLSALTDCQIIFICSSESARMTELLQRLQGRPILTVSDDPGFAQRGGIIGFIKDSGRVKFEINSVAAAASQLQMSAKLLQVGKLVSSPTREVNQ